MGDVHDHERDATRKAALWACLAGLALVLLAVDRGTLFIPRDVLAAVGYAFALPAIALLHARHAAQRSSGAVLATIAAVAALLVGLMSRSSSDLNPASLVLLGMWWWTLGKMAVQTGSLPRPFGLATAGAGVIAFAGVLVVASLSALPDLARLVLGVWLISLGIIFARGREGP